MYALAASAAGVGALALAQPAEAKIVYTPTYKHIGPQQSFPLDLNHDGRVDFTLSNVVGINGDTNSYSLLQKPASDNSAAGYVVGRELLLGSALKRGAGIGAGAAPFRKGNARLASVIAHIINGTSNVSGPWANVKGRYLGLRFQIRGRTHYGWARMNVEIVGTTINATLTGYAYETIPNKPIIAGKTKGSDDAVTLQSGSLGHLAAGASAIPAWRVKRTVATTH